ncbi:YdcF family protein [Micromonospora siamensis]|uniref:DUF218 domain-containing protein n=1 Tax=Micromonospora siamensis TaxID=299152 RepID=A0A1C5HX70_9ACTN|nr:YdcF family protein [Micromonospora siamensis]SCG50665.1 DUF218 domain-containing protein [Micromonospora siamensis]
MGSHGRTPVGSAPPTAPVLVVFGRGVDCVGGGYRLGPDGLARVRAAVDYVAAHRGDLQRAARRGRPPRIIFTGGWAEACEGAAAPPAGSREGELMLRAARAAGLHRYADLRVESRSRSTLENLVHTAADGLLAGWEFDARQPLGLVSHSWHLPRVRLLAAKVLGLRGPALRDVPVSEPDPRGRRSERAARLACRVAYLGVGDPAALLRRERAMVASLRRVERLGAALGRR